MSQKHYAPLFKTFTWLRGQHTLDAKCERVLKMISKRHRRVLVAGNANSGKNTVANAIFAYWHELGREAFFTPTVSCKTPGGLWTHPSFKTYRSCFTSGQPVITPMKYEQEFYGEQHLPGLFASARNFDVVVDCRRLPDGTRLVAQVFCRRGQSWTCLYRSPTFAGLQIGLAA
jgi:hypothetical protein